MPFFPEITRFTCEKCGRRLHTGHRSEKSIFPFRNRLAVNPNGTCKGCQGEWWTMSLLFLEQTAETDGSLLNMFTKPLFGFAAEKTTIGANVISYEHIPARVVASLNERPRERTQRIMDLASVLERQELAAHGAKVCLTCSVKFVPHPDKPWTLNGYCVRACDPDQAEAYGHDADFTATPIRSVVAVTCPAGHRFEVASSFRGMARPCPHCGVKTVVSD